MSIFHGEHFVSEMTDSNFEGDVHTLAPYVMNMFCAKTV